MRIITCDDDLLIIEKLQKYLKSYFNHLHLKCPEIISFSSGESLLADQGPKDIIFLDIEMPGLNGIYVGNELKKRNKNTIIFIITSYSEYLDEAMRFHVFRYLSKPIDKQRLFRNLKDALDLYHSMTVQVPLRPGRGFITCRFLLSLWWKHRGKRLSFTLLHVTMNQFIRCNIGWISYL